MKINCIIVDDEPVSQDILRKYVADTPTLNLLQVCNNAFEASEALMQHKIDLIFLDINMPKLSGMKFYKSLNNPPYVIFTTAYPEFAAEGFEVDAIDYLLKPFPFDRFLKAVNRAIERIRKPERKIASGEYILLKADKKLHRVNLSDISHLEALGDYVKVFYADTFILVHETLQRLLDQLPENEFIRVHKSFVISTANISYVEGSQVKIGEREIPIGKIYKETFLRQIRQ
ncbi:MAG: response regulator transcription factor [Bacteroidales bacterium]|nr:response regulator transcription factor [Bacteroidales bacterium]